MAYCNWCKTSPINQRYHDEEWGVPLHDDNKQFEFLMLEVLQCGISWSIVINKRDIFRSCFDNFDYEKIASYDKNMIEKIMATKGMIKSRKKTEAIIHNAKCFINIRREFGSFSRYLWKFTDNKTILYDKHGDGFIPASNGLSDVISADLKKRGFKFLGPVTIYSHLQACGIINDHGSDCPCYKNIIENYPCRKQHRDNEKNVVKF